MHLGPQMWNAAKPFYDKLTLAVDGERLAEQPAALNGNITGQFSNYERFWRYHVCPATQRPNAITFRPRVADIVSVIVQRNYSVFVYAVEARQFLTKARQGDTGPRDRNYIIALMYAGNALQVFTEFQRAVCGKPEPDNLGGIRCLSVELGVSIVPFPDWRENWKAERESASNYRNYITHEGWPYCVFQQATGKTLVLRPDALKAKGACTWKRAENDYAANPSNWIEFGDSCQGIVNDTIAFLDLGYERIVSEMEPLLVNPTYQRLWGWYDNQPIPPATTASAPTPPGGTAKGTTPSWMSGSTSSPVDTRPRTSGSGETIV